MERIFSGGLSDNIDNRLMSLTAKRWLRKEKKHKTNRKGERVGLKTNRHFSRPNPAHFQKKILEAYAGTTDYFLRREII